MATKSLPIDKLFSFATTLEGLKKLERFRGQFYWRDYPQLQRYESVADHTWRLSMFVIMLEPYLSKKINLELALKIAAIHDVQEIIGGDDTPLGNDGTGKTSYAFDAKKKQLRSAHEKAAAKKLFRQLPTGMAKDFYTVWLDYEEQKSFEAKVVKALDKIEAALQVLEYRNGHMYPAHLQFDLAYVLPFTKIDPAIAVFGEAVLERTKKKYKEFKK